MIDLIIGGTNGLGLELARDLAEQGNEIIVTGRNDPQIDFAEFKAFDLSQQELSSRIGAFVADLPSVRSLIYAAGFYQDGSITDLSDEDIETMLNVCGRGLIYFTKAILEKQGQLDELVTITSTSQWTPRKLEPIYNFVKAGEGHFANAIAEDERVSKVLVAGPAGMNTPFWKGVERDDLDQMLDPAWVAQQIQIARQGDYKYKFIKILRGPARVDEVEKR